MKKYSPGSTDFPSHKDGIPGLLFLCCDIVQTTHPFWASVSLCSSFLGLPPKPHPPHTFSVPPQQGWPSRHMAAMPAAHCARLLFLSFQPTWHLLSFKSQFKHHFLRKVSLQAQLGPMLPLKTTLHAFITHADVYASGWWFHSCLSPPVDYQLLRRQAVCLYSSLNPKKLNIVEARLMCVGWRNKINQPMDIKWDDIYQVIIIIIEEQCTLITIHPSPAYNP